MLCLLALGELFNHLFVASRYVVRRLALISNDVLVGPLPAAAHGPISFGRLDRWCWPEFRFYDGLNSSAINQEKHQNNNQEQAQTAARVIA